MPIQSVSLYDLLTERSTSWPDLKIFTFLDDRGAERKWLTYAQLLENSLKVASHLQSKTDPGDRVLLLLEDQSEFTVALLACLLTGVIAVPAQAPRRNGKETKILNILSDCEPALIVGNRKLHEACSKRNADLANQKWLYFEELEQQLSGFAEHRPKPQDTALIQYTSGTQGAPRGVVISYANIASNSGIIQSAMKLDKQTKFVSWLPHYHDMGLFGSILEPVFSAVPAVFLSPMGFAQKPLNWLKAISRYKATISGGPNFAYQHCVERISPEDCAGLDLSSWQLAYCGAEMVKASTLRAFSEKFAAFGFDSKALMPCYGMAEATLMISCSPYSQGLKTTILKGEKGQNGREIVSCGKVSKQSVIRIVNEQGEVNDQGIGEIWYKSDNVANGYWKNSERSEAVFDHRLEDNTGYLRTGDLGFIENGALYLTGRQKELIIHRGRNFYPQDIEPASSESDTGLMKDGVVAFSIDGASEELIILQELKRSWIRKHNYGKIIGQIQESVFEHVGLSPSVIALLKPGSLPRTSSGKLSRVKAKDRFVKQQFDYLAIKTFDQKFEHKTPSSRTTLEDVQESILQLLKSSSPLDDHMITADTSIFEMGIDSVAAVDLTVAIEAKLGIGLDAALLWQFETVEEISRYIYENKICSDDLESV